MVRTQVQLTEEQAAELKAVAAQRGVSVAQLVRDAVAGLLGRAGADVSDERWERAMSIVGRFRSGLPDLGERHDDYLTEETGVERLRGHVRAAGRGHNPGARKGVVR